MKFKTIKEILKALIDGKNIRRSSWMEGIYVYMGADGNIYDQNGKRSGVVLSKEAEFMELYEPINE